MATTVPQYTRDGRTSEATTNDGPFVSGERGQGWLMFAGIVLMTGGLMRFFDAIWAFSYHGVVPQNLQNALFGHSLNTYGWMWLVVSIVLFVSGFAVMLRIQIARWVGVGAAALGAVSAIWWMPYYPIWSLTYIGLGVLVVYALVAHGQRAKALQ